jgi:hypothetical protein
MRVLPLIISLLLLASETIHASTVERLLANPAFVTRMTRDAPKPTGDALFDRYAAEIWQRNAPGAYAGEGISTAACLPDDLLAAWEAEFGNDPRYWQLRYFCARALKTDAEPEVSWTEELFKPEAAAGEAEASAQPAYNGPDPVSFLEAGIARGAYDCATLKALFNARLDSMLAGDPKQLAPQRELQPGAAEQLVPLAAKLVSEFPEEADSWTIQALVNFELGNDAAAFDDLKAGNAAPSSRYVTFFPASAAMQAAIDGTSTGSDYVNGMISQGMSDYVVHDHIWRKHIRRCSELAVQSVDLSDWQVLDEFAARQAMRKGGSIYREAALHNYVRGITRAFLVEAPEKLSVEQRSAMWKYQNRYAYPITEAFRQVSYALTDHGGEVLQLYPWRLGQGGKPCSFSPAAASA